MQESPLRYDFNETLRAAEFLASKFNPFPATAIFAGTGLGDLSDELDEPRDVDYCEIPNFPSSTVLSHAGRLVCGRLEGHATAILQGRFHLYEGHPAKAVAFPVRVLQALGVRTLVLTNAAGGLNPTFKVGEIMIITDHLNLTSANPLLGPEEVRWGMRFPDMTAAYAPAVREAAQDAAAARGLSVRQGVYAGLAGPSLETPAEMRFLRIIGADAVGFSTVLETIAAVHGGMRVLGLSTITNLCLPDAPVAAGVEDIIAAARAAAPRIGALIAGVLHRLPKTA